MKSITFTTLALTGAVLLSGCVGSKDVTSPAAHAVTAPALATLADLAVPVLHSATIVGDEQGFPIVRLTFTDTAEDEALANAYFTLADGSHVTQSIGGTAGTGERVVDVYALPGVVDARVNFMFADASFGTQCGCVFGGFSASVPVTDGAVTVTKKKGKH